MAKNQLEVGPNIPEGAVIIIGERAWGSSALEVLTFYFITNNPRPNPKTIKESSTKDITPIDWSIKFPFSFNPGDEKWVGERKKETRLKLHGAYNYSSAKEAQEPDLAKAA